VRQGDQSPHQVRPASRHADVGQDECSAVVVSGSHRRVAVDRPTDDAEVALLLQHPGHGRSDAVVVVRDDDGDLIADWGRHRSKIAHNTSVCRDTPAPLA
jgi:hypothetical protein